MLRKIIIRGKIQKGRGLAKELGYPTINIPYKGKVRGVYVADAEYKDKTYPASVFVGERFSINDPTPICEIHLLDFIGRINEGEEVVVKLLYRIRDAKKFENLNDLKSAIAADVAFTRNWYNL